MILLAVREAFQESLCFIPFELVFGHYGRSLKDFEIQICEHTVISILDYVECFNYKLARACDIEHDNLKQSQAKMKQWYDKDAIVRELKPGEKVIVLLLIHCHPLQAKFVWPYVIESRLNDLNYIANTPTRRKKKSNMSSDNTRLL